MAPAAGFSCGAGRRAITADGSPRPSAACHAEGRRTGIGRGAASTQHCGTARRLDGGRGALHASTVHAVNRLIPVYHHRGPQPAAPRTSARRRAVLRALCLPAALGMMGLAGGLLPGRVEAQVSRCVDRQGNSVFTDRSCEAVDSASRVPHAERTGRRGSAYRGACARSLPMLIRDLSSAIDSGDANRLGMLYLWAGVSDADAVRTFNRLQSIVERPLVDIVPLRREVTVAAPSPPAPPAEAAAATAAPRPAASHPDVMQWDGDPSAGDSSASVPSAPAAGSAAAQATTRTRTVVTGLRLQQTAGKRAASIPVVLGLRRAYDCWWISLPGGG